MNRTSGDVRVLVVDDQEPFRRAMAAVVEATDGFVMVGTAASGEESVRVAREVEPDLVLMDVNLPGIDGVEATRQITRPASAASQTLLVANQTGSRPSGPVVVLLSTYDEDEFNRDDCGATAYVPKGAFGPDRLRQAWDAAVAES